MIQIHQLPASGTIADTDMIPFDTGSVNKYAAWANLAKQRKMPLFPNTQLLTATVDALTVGRVYDFAISAGNQTASGLPTNRTFVGTAYCYSDAAKIIIIHAVSVNEEWYIRKGSSGWSTWCLRSGELNGTITRNAIMNTSDTIKVVQHGGMATFQMACRIITAGTYDTSTVLCTSSIKPVSTFSGVMLHGSNHTIVRITVNGEVTFNSSTTVAENNWLIGQITFPVKEV